MWSNTKKRHKEVKLILVHCSRVFQREARTKRTVSKLVALMWASCTCSGDARGIHRTSPRHRTIKSGDTAVNSSGDYPPELFLKISSRLCDVDGSARSKCFCTFHAVSRLKRCGMPYEIFKMLRQIWLGCAYAFCTWWIFAGDYPCLTNCASGLRGRQSGFGFKVLDIVSTVFGDLAP